MNKHEFEILFKSHYSALCAFAYKYLNDVTACEDIVQEVFFTLWNNESTKPIQSATSYLYVSVKNKCFNELKHQKVVEAHEKVIDLSSIFEMNFDDQIIEEETHCLIYNAIKSLPKKCSEVVLLSLKGFKNEEIAGELNVSINTIKTQKKIAYKQLRIKLKDVYVLTPFIIQQFLN